MIVTLLAKTGIGKGELCNSTISDLGLPGDEIAATNDIESRRWNPTGHPSLRIRIPNAETELTAGRSVAETIVPFDDETIYELKRWLLIRPDTRDHEGLFTSASVWGRRISGAIVSERIRVSDSVGWNADDLTAFTLRAFFTGTTLLKTE